MLRMTMNTNTTLAKLIFLKQNRSYSYNVSMKCSIYATPIS